MIHEYTSYKGINVCQKTDTYQKMIHINDILYMILFDIFIYKDKHVRMPSVFQITHLFPPHHILQPIRWHVSTHTHCR